MKQTINLGAYGWRHRHWSNTFYPEDLPVDDSDDWRLTYYSNEFSAVLIPADYWHAEMVSDCEDWLDSVHPAFRFFVECRSGMFNNITLAGLAEALKSLAPQLSALVILDEDEPVTDTVKKQFIELADSLAIDVFGGMSDIDNPVIDKKGIWWLDGCSENLQDISELSHFAVIEDDLLDLRSVRANIEQFTEHVNDEEHGAEATIIVSHPRLQAADLSKFRAVLDIMGC